MTQQLNTSPAIEAPWVAAMVRYVSRCGPTRAAGLTCQIVDLTRAIESTPDARARAACRLRRADCWEALAAATDKSDPCGELTALACRCAAALDRDGT
ncbi:hypothetical protein ATK36_4280 [Amycolatopsis sulphurea]|uniref:Uncharacterized protein n=1 Tax=Amycolatopsis sulphurea TaxID=76022 RepID=A0A2A9FFG1_9PSEU|nr:hypothetical protein [Amycolatopsis sulphurea]PFG49149.1 hypothetical protein ATK36_4280 [Amycolatopsis sulphurea]